MVDAVSQGYVKGLPEGWIDCHVAFRPLRDRIIEALSGEEPAPWLASKSDAFWGGISSDQVDGIKLGWRVSASVQKALLKGALNASLFNGEAFKELPKQAFVD